MRICWILKQFIQLNLAEYHLILVHSAYGISIRQPSVLFVKCTLLNVAKEKGTKSNSREGHYNNTRYDFSCLLYFLMNWTFHFTYFHWLSPVVCIVNKNRGNTSGLERFLSCDMTDIWWSYRPHLGYKSSYILSPLLSESNMTSIIAETPRLNHTYYLVFSVFNPGTLGVWHADHALVMLYAIVIGAPSKDAKVHNWYY